MTIEDAGTAYPALAFRMRTDAPDVELAVEVSADLQTWQSGDAFTFEVDAGLDNGDGTLTRTIRTLHPLAERSVQYLRLRAELR
jgi:hypothetical protein